MLVRRVKVLKTSKPRQVKVPAVTQDVVLDDELLSSHCKSIKHITLLTTVLKSHTIILPDPIKLAKVYYPTLEINDPPCPNT